MNLYWHDKIQQSLAELNAVADRWAKSPAGQFRTCYSAVISEYPQLTPDEVTEVVNEVLGTHEPTPEPQISYRDTICK